MKHTRALISATAALATNAAFAAPVDYSTSFTDSETPAFADIKLDGQNSWLAHPVYTVSDAAGLGLLNRVNAAGPIHVDTSTDVTSELAAGETITLTLLVNFVGVFANQNNGAWMVGLTSDPLAFPEGANAIGAATFQNVSNSNFWVSASTLNNATKHDTGIAWDGAYRTLTTTITKSATMDEFDITADLDGQSTSYTMTNAALYGGATAYAGFRFRGNQDGNVDSFSVTSSGTSSGGGEITIDSTSYEAGTGVTIDYTSTAGAVDVYLNATGDLSPGNFSLLASGETDGSFLDATADHTSDPKAFYVVVSTGDLPFTP